MSAERLRTETIVWLSTLQPDGRPHLTPIWFCWVHDRVWICTNASAVKARNISRDPRVSLCLQDGMKPVVMEGHGIVHSRPYPDDVVSSFLERFGWDISRPDTDGPYDALIEVVPQRWLMGSAG
jgi:PPOX class probable F420-dependent enzyme